MGIPKTTCKLLSIARFYPPHPLTLASRLPTHTIITPKQTTSWNGVQGRGKYKPGTPITPVFEHLMTRRLARPALPGLAIRVTRVMTQKRKLKKTTLCHSVYLSNAMRSSGLVYPGHRTPQYDSNGWKEPVSMGRSNGRTWTKMWTIAVLYVPRACAAQLKHTPSISGY